MPAGKQAKQARKIAASGRIDNMLEREPVLVPKWVLWCAFLISFTLPNLVFSGRYWFDTLHIMKWAVTMVPVGVVALICGVQLVRYGAERSKFVLDPFGLMWLLLVLLITAQPAFIKLTSISTFAKEWFYFATLFALYILSYNLCKDERLFKALLWGANINAAINVLFAELLIRHMNKGYPFILDVPGNYIGNTAQQEMFGLWMAMAVLNGLFLHVFYMGTHDATIKKSALYKDPLILGNLFLLAVNAWGLWNSTARGGILSLVVAFCVLCVVLWRKGESYALKGSLKLFGVVLLLLVVALGSSYALGIGRGFPLVHKMMDMIKNPTSVGHRISIWTTSREVFLKEPITGVGLGQYKWHFLDGQRIMYHKYPELLQKKGYNWQFTYWAHSEYIQWFCETGIIGGAILLAMGGWWLYSFIRALVQRASLPPQAIWGASMIFLLWFDALFSRPFHRIENSVWMSLAFALSNRSMIVGNFKSAMWRSDLLIRSFGILFIVVTLYGFVFLSGGMMGDQLIYRTISRQAGAMEKQTQLKKAETYLMSRDDAREQMANLFIQVGKLQNDPNVFTEGVRSLYAAFVRRPTSKLLFELLNYSKQFENRELFDALATYLNPGMLTSAPSRERPVSE